MATAIVLHRKVTEFIDDGRRIRGKENFLLGGLLYHTQTLVL